MNVARAQDDIQISSMSGCLDLWIPERRHKRRSGMLEVADDTQLKKREPAAQFRPNNLEKSVQADPVCSRGHPAQVDQHRALADGFTRLSRLIVGNGDVGHLLRSGCLDF